MKVKKYSKKTGRVTGSRYKRLQWKKLQVERESGRTKGGERVKKGNFVCFKCGKPGHWARNCTNKGGYEKLGSFDGEKVLFHDDYNEEEEEDDDFDQLLAECPFPSVEETAAVDTHEEEEKSCSKDLGSSGLVSASLSCSPATPNLLTDMPKAISTPVNPLLPLDNGQVPESKYCYHL